MILQKQAFGMCGMHCDLVHTLTELGITIGIKCGSHAPILRSPGLPTVDCAIDSAGRDGDVHALIIGRIEHDSVQS